MSSLLLRLSAPLQSWGSSSKFNKRMTNREPTKSGVIGMIAAAMGLRRDDDLHDLQKIRFGVRIDQEGVLIKDFHTAHTFDNKQSFISDRYYLADALFIVGLEGEDMLLQDIEAAVKNPVFPLYLGRRSCPPAGQISLGFREGVSLLEALRDESWHASDWYKKQAPPEVSLEIVYDAEPQNVGAYTLRDIPVSFSQVHRKYAFRSVMNVIDGNRLPNPASRYARYQESPTEHDPMAGLIQLSKEGD